LLESLTKNFIVDASKYLDALGKRNTSITEDQKEYNARVINQKTIDSTSDASALASAGIVNFHDTEEGYMLSNNVLRQEVIGMAMKLG
jgi:hypothetical protein